MGTPFLLCLLAVGSGCGPAETWATLRAAPSAFLRREDPLVELARELRATRPEDRKRALRQLATEGSPAAWRLVFSALADPESQVGDEAQLMLARIPTPALAAELAGRAGLAHREPSVRRRAAEGLGRVPHPVDVEVLASAFDDREIEVGRLALWSVERMARDRRLSGDLERGALLLERAARVHRDGSLRASAVCARAALAARGPKEVRAGDGGEAADSPARRELVNFNDFLQRCREDRDPRVRAAVAMAARALPEASALALLQPLANDPRDAVRLARIETLEILACKSSVTALIAALEAETMERARREAMASLQRLSGLKHRLDPRPWRDWAATLEPSWKPTLFPGFSGAPSPRQPPAPGGEARTVASVSFVGMALVSPRVCFAIDFSGSMWTPMPDGRLPKDLVDARLRATLESLPRSTEFNIVPFTNEVLPWRPKLVPATPANVREAIQDFERCQARGRGNFYDAAVLALEDPAVDTLLTLTDGVPTGGFHSHLDLVIPLLLERNRFRRVAFDTVLVDAPPASMRRWQVLSQHSGGRLVATEKAE